MERNMNLLTDKKLELLPILKEMVVAYPGGNTTAIIFNDVSGFDPERLNTGLMARWQYLHAGSAIS